MCSSSTYRCEGDGCGKPKDCGGKTGLARERLNDQAIAQEIRQDSKKLEICYWIFNSSNQAQIEDGRRQC